MRVRIRLFHFWVSLLLLALSLGGGIRVAQAAEQEDSPYQPVLYENSKFFHMSAPVSWLTITISKGDTLLATITTYGEDRRSTWGYQTYLDTSLFHKGDIITFQIYDPTQEKTYTVPVEVQPTSSTKTTPPTKLTPIKEKDTQIRGEIRGEVLYGLKSLVTITRDDETVAQGITYVNDDDSQFFNIPLAEGVSLQEGDQLAFTAETPGFLPSDSIEATVHASDYSPEDEEAVNQDVTWLQETMSYMEYVPPRVDLPTAGMNGTTITWWSSKPDVIAPTGEISPPKKDEESVTLKATITKGNTSKAVEFRAIVRKQKDSTPPVTTLQLCEKCTPSEQGWFNQSVSFTLSAQDDQSGVKQTEYQLTKKKWERYKKAVSVKKEGIYQIQYRSTDLAGNGEEPQKLELKIDKTAPKLDVSVNKSKLWPVNHELVPIQVKLKYHDSLSGLHSVELVSITSNEADMNPDDIQGADYGTEDTSFLLRAERTGSGKKNAPRIYSITYVAKDAAGNETKKVVQVTVPKK
ncbi:OmpL47-type beta-barrel domain-containing protein [Brevibacillus centrosporus]|uniref:OmpL47-type beta-barrel domain-containing protein n=1 Tax=Brevibacillus centrosporus TaxID=54910 RepID=UPI003B01AC2D